MIKKTTFAIILTMAPAVLLANTSTTELSGEAAGKRILPPISLELSETMDTNFSKTAGKNDPTLTHSVDASTSFSKELNAKLTLSDGPDINFQYVPVDESDNTTFNFENSLSLAYALSERTNLGVSSTQGYVREFDFNDQQEFIKSQYYYVSLKPNFSRDFGKSFNLSGNMGVSLEDYMTPSTVSDPDESDNMTLSASLTPTYKPNENVSLSLPIYTEQWRARTKKSLLPTGLPGGKLAEQQDYTKLMLKASFTQGDLTISPQVGFHKNRDLEFGAKDYDGNVLQISVAYSTEKFSYSSYLMSKTYNYSSQLVDPAGDSTTPLYEYSRLKIFNGLTFPGAVLGGDLGFGHTMEQYSSNRDSLNFINQSFNLKVNFSI